jgi:hypothetical protein
MFNAFEDVLKLTRQESDDAIDIGFSSYLGYFKKLRPRGREVIDRLEREGRVGIVMLGRPYHSDPGLNHDIMDELQKRGYPVFSIDSLPQDPDILDRLFGEEVRAGIISDPMDISDVWKNAYSENSSKKVWAAKFVARHPNLVAVDLSSFKCGHDAPIYDPIERIIEATGTPYFTFHDVDENKPTGSINIRVETMDYFLQRYQEFLKRRINSEEEVRQLVDNYRAQMTKTNDRARKKAEAAALQNSLGIGAVSISSNNSRAFMKNGHGLGDHSSNGNGNGHVADVTDLSDPANGRIGTPAVSNGSSGVYDSILAENTADDPPDLEPIASDAASCGSPIKDFDPRAFANPAEQNGNGGMPAVPAQLMNLETIKQMLKANPKPKKAKEASPIK